MELYRSTTEKKTLGNYATTFSNYAQISLPYYIIM